MRTSTRLPIAIHALVMIAWFSGERRVSSELIAASAGVNAVSVRTILGELKRAGLVHILPGKGGTTLARDAGDITLWDVYACVESDGANIHRVLGGHFDSAVDAMRAELSRVSISDIVGELVAAAAQEGTPH